MTETTPKPWPHDLIQLLTQQGDLLDALAEKASQQSRLIEAGRIENHGHAMMNPLEIGIGRRRQDRTRFDDLTALAVPRLVESGQGQRRALSRLEMVGLVSL